MQYQVGTYRGCDYNNVQEAIEQDAIYLYDTWVDEDMVSDVREAMSIGIIASGREDEMNFFLKNSDGEYADIPLIDWDGDVDKLFESYLGTHNEPNKEYSVDITRTGYSKKTIKVTASSEEEAKEKAFDIAGDFEYSEYDADYDVDVIKV